MEIVCKGLLAKKAASDCNWLVHSRLAVLADSCCVVCVCVRAPLGTYHFSLIQIFTNKSEWHFILENFTPCDSAADLSGSEGAQLLKSARRQRNLPVCWSLLFESTSKYEGTKRTCNTQYTSPEGSNRLKVDQARPWWMQCYHCIVLSVKYREREAKAKQPHILQEGSSKISIVFLRLLLEEVTHSVLESMSG